MSSSIRPTSPYLPAAVSFNNTQRQTGTFNIPDILAKKNEVGITSTTVAISTAARDQPENQVVKSGSFSPEMLALRNNDDDESLGKYLKSVVYEDNSMQGDGAGGLLDITDYMNGGPLRYSKTGEPVTAESRAYFNKTEQSYRSEKISLYEMELDKGTDLHEIYKKLADLTAQQPERFLAMKGYTA